MEFLDSLNDFAACIAVAACTAPDAYPAWSDGFRAHFAEIMLLWAGIRPQVRRDVDQARGIDVVLQKMAAAIEVGETCSYQEAAQILHGRDLVALR